MARKLSKSPHVPRTSAEGETILIYAPTGMGKTTLLCQFVDSVKNGLLIRHTRDSKGADYHKTIQEPVSSWEDFAEVVKALEAEGGRELVAVDGLHLLFEDCVQAVAESMYPGNPDQAFEGKWGNVWNKIRLEFIPWIEKLRACSKTLVISCRARWDTLALKREITKFFPDIPPSTWKYLVDKIGILGFMYRAISEGAKAGTETEPLRNAVKPMGERVLYIHPTEFYDAKCSCPGMPDVIELGDADSMLKNFRAAFKKGGK